MTKFLLFTFHVLITIVILGEVNTAQALTTLDDIEEGDDIKITGKGEGICTDSEGVTGIAKARVRYQMLVQEKNENGFSGIARADIAVRSTCAEDIVLKKFDSLDFNFDVNACKLILIKDSHIGVFHLCNDENLPASIDGSLSWGSPDHIEIEIKGQAYFSRGEQIWYWPI